jgi:hypothetical protein
MEIFRVIWERRRRGGRPMAWYREERAISPWQHQIPR